jgi:hypothetical protein
MPGPTLVKHIRRENALQIFTSFALVATLVAHDAVRIACDCSVLSMGDVFLAKTSRTEAVLPEAASLLEPPDDVFIIWQYVDSHRSANAVTRAWVWVWARAGRQGTDSLRVKWRQKKFTVMKVRQEQRYYSRQERIEVKVKARHTSANLEENRSLTPR